MVIPGVRHKYNRYNNCNEQFMLNDFSTYAALKIFPLVESIHMRLLLQNSNGLLKTKEFSENLSNRAITDLTIGARAALHSWLIGRGNDIYSYELAKCN